MAGRSKLEEIIVFTYIKYALCFSLRSWRPRVALMKASSPVFLLNLNRDHLRLGHDLLAVEERNLTDRQLTDYLLLSTD